MFSTSLHLCLALKRRNKAWLSTLRLLLLLLFEKQTKIRVDGAIIEGTKE
jgi:hypothetical protein